MPLAGRRRRRRRLWVLLGAFLSLVVLAVHSVATSSSSEPNRRLEELAYVDAVRPLIEQSNQQGDDLTDVRDSIAQLGRPAAGRRLTRIHRQTAEVLTAVQAAEPPPSLATAHGLLTTTMFVREQAAGAIAKGLQQALSNDAFDEPIGALAEAGEDLTTADRTYALFQRAVGASGNADVSVPPSRWVVDATAWAPQSLRALVSTLRSSASLAPIHDVSVLLVTTEPAPVGRDDATQSDVLPPARALRLEVVVANIGNETERNVAVVALLTGPTRSPDTAREFVDLEPGQRRTVSLGGLVPVAGTMSTLTVRIGPISNEADPSNNELVRSILIRGS